MLNTEWQLSGNMAERYEEFLVPVIFVPWAQELLNRADLKPGNRLLDLACGTGIVSRLAADKGIIATGGDINAGMLAVANACSENLNIDFQEADACNLPYDDQRFDAVICQQGLQFFPDKSKALAECFRVLKPGGRAIFCTARELEENPLMNAQVEAFKAYLGQNSTGAIQAVCGFADPKETQALFAGAGFEPIEVSKVVLTLKAENATVFVDGLMKATPVADKITAMNEDDRKALQGSMIAAFGAYYDGKALTFPHSANVAIAVRPAG